MERIDFRDQIAKNKLNSFFLMLSIVLFIVLIGYVISQAMGQGYFFIIMIFAIIFSLTYVLIGFYYSDKMAIFSVGAVLADKKKYKDYYNLVEGLTLASGLPMPKLYVMESPQINAFASGRNPANSVVCVTTTLMNSYANNVSNQINAFASGRNPQHAVICVTDGALEKLDKKELEGVLAHELSHVANYDIRYMTLVTILVGMVSIISEIFLRSLWFRDRDDNKGAIFMIIGIVLAILAPIVVYLVQLSISRKREYSADASAVKFTRYPTGLIGALKKIRDDSIVEEKHISKAVAPLFFSNPLKGITSTHPPIEDRIKILERM